MCKMPLVARLILLTSYVAYICVYIHHVCLSNTWNIWGHALFGGIFVSDIYLVLTCKVHIAVIIIWLIYAKMLGLNWY